MAGVWPAVKAVLMVLGVPLKVGTSEPPWILYITRRPMILAFSLMVMPMFRRSRVDHWTELLQSWALTGWAMGMGIPAAGPEGVCMKPMNCW